MVRVATAASFIKNNMPLGQLLSLTDQETWDTACYMNSQERPQDPRYTGDSKETREKYGPTFHKNPLYDQTREVDGKLLGDHSSTDEK